MNLDRVEISPNVRVTENGLQEFVGGMWDNVYEKPLALLGDEDENKDRQWARTGLIIAAALIIITLLTK